jgi:hypothetical protein
MHGEILRLTHELYDLLLKLEHHVPDADAAGKRLMYEVKQKLKEISKTAEQSK